MQDIAMMQTMLNKLPYSQCAVCVSETVLHSKFFMGCPGHTLTPPSTTSFCLSSTVVIKRCGLAGVYVYHMCLVLFLPVQSLLTCFRSFLTRFADFVSNNSSSDTKAFLRFITFSGSPTAVYRPLHALRYYTVGIPF